MRTFESRPYQQKAIADLRDALEVHDSAILYAPTGAGKTAIACDITSRAAALGSRVIFIGDSVEIIDQTSETMRYWEISHGVIQAGSKRARMWEKVHIATIQTLRNRELPAKDLVFIDEAHLSRASTWHAVIEAYKKMGARVIGLSATPCRLDGKGLGELFQTIVYCPSIQALTDQGYLVPITDIYSFPTGDMTNVRTTAGEYDKKERAAVMDKATLIGDAVQHYIKLAKGKLAILRAASIEHSKHLVEAFRHEGIPAAHCDGTTPKEDRKRILSSLPARDIWVLCQVDICGKGWDCPAVEVAIDCCPTQSVARWLQFIGRILRPSPGKEGAILLDHAGNMKHGDPAEERTWSLDGAVKPSKDKEPSISLCRWCYRCFKTGPRVCPFWKADHDSCPSNGAEIEVKARKVTVADGELVKVDRSKQRTQTAEDWRKALARDEERKAKYMEFAKTAAHRAYKPGWLPMTYKQIFGEYPPKEWRDEAVGLGLVRQ
jgi:superfamily II DNA or RNA helicase